MFDTVNLLKELNIKRYQMSLDGLEKKHDMSRSLYSYKTTISAIKLLNKENIPVNINIQLMRIIRVICGHYFMNYIKMI